MRGSAENSPAVAFEIQEVDCSDRTRSDRARATMRIDVRENVGRVETPEPALKGFSRIRLQPREARIVTFIVPQRQFAGEMPRTPGR